jgi:hypothetical protein
MAAEPGPLASPASGALMPTSTPVRAQQFMAQAPGEPHRSCRLVGCSHVKGCGVGSVPEESIPIMTYVTAIFMPLLLMGCSSILKKLTHPGGFKLGDFFLGIELTLAALSAGLLYLMVPAADSTRGTEADVAGSAGVSAAPGMFVAVAFILLLYVTALHQEWEAAVADPKGQKFWLVYVANAIGAGLFVAFILLVQGIR